MTGEKNLSWTDSSLMRLVLLVGIHILLGGLYLLIFAPIGLILKLSSKDAVFFRGKQLTTYWQDST